MSDCIFCKIIAGEIPSTKVYEDEFCVAFRDINPQKHLASVLEFSEEDRAFLGGIQLAIAKIARQEGLTENGFRVINNCGKDAMQTVPHLHYHILAGGPMGERIV